MPTTCLNLVVQLKKVGWNNEQHFLMNFGSQLAQNTSQILPFPRRTVPIQMFRFFQNAYIRVFDLYDTEASSDKHLNSKLEKMNTS